MYVDENKKYDDTKSTGYSFTLVGILGLAFILLLWLGLIPLEIAVANKIMISIVMGIVFLIFLIIGLRSFSSLSKIKRKAVRQDMVLDEAIEWFLDEYQDQMLVQFDSEDESVLDEDLYFQRYDFIFNNLKEKYSEVSEEDIDHMAEEIYNKIYK